MSKEGELVDGQRPNLNALPQKSGTSGTFRKRVAVHAQRYAGSDPLIIHTLEGDMTAMPGDWIITGVRGETYPCKPDIFEQTYERIET